MAESESKLDLVIAIEIGNTYSGYVYFSGNENHRILTATYGNGLPKDRVPTALLMNGNSTFNSFGTLAKDKYFNITLQQEQANYLYFEKCLQTSIETLEQSADYYAEIIKYLYKQCLKCLNEKNGERKIEVEDILFIFPVNDETEKLLNLAVDKAKIKKNNVRLVLETDAAALYCGDQNMLLDNGGNVNKLTVGCIFAILDLGGKKAQYCKYEVLGKDKYRRISEVVLAPFGGETVTEIFMKKLESIVGKTDWENFTTENKSSYLRIRRSFEKQKLTFDSSKSDIVIEVPTAFMVLKHDKNCDGISFEDDNKIIVQLGNLFDDSLREIVEKLKFDKDIDIILLVGGFSESSYVRDYIKRNIKSIRTVLVPAPDLVVLKGAVMMGHKQLYMSEYAYGFVEESSEEHPESTSKGEHCCKGVFKKVIHINEMVGPCQLREERLIINGMRKNEEIILYRTKDPNVMLFNQDTKECFEQIVKKAPTGEWQDKVTARVLVNVGNHVPNFTLEIEEEKSETFFEKMKSGFCKLFK